MIESWDLLSTVLPGVAAKLGMALLCGFLLGTEREVHDKPAGLRTIMLITVGATLFMIVSNMIALTTEGAAAITRVDTSRIASQVVTGIGFLGAGAIIESRGSVRGLTTASTIWVAAGIGLCIGADFPLIGLGTTLLVLVVLVAMRPFRVWVNRRGEIRSIVLIVPNDRLLLRRIENLLSRHEIPQDMQQVRVRSPDEVELHIQYHNSGSNKNRLLSELALFEGVRGMEVEFSAGQAGSQVLASL